MLLQEKALFRQHFCKSISALTRLLPIDKNFAQIFVYEQRERYFKTKLNLYAKKKIQKTFLQDVTVWLLRMRTLGLFKKIFKFNPLPLQVVRLVIETPHTKFQLIWFTGRGGRAI